MQRTEWVLLRRILSIAAALALTAGTVAAQGRSNGRGRGNGNDVAKTDAKVVVVFRDTDRASFRDYFVSHKMVGEPLPPGIAKNVARGKPLPPGIAKKALPRDLVVIAPRVERDVSLAIVGNVVVAMRAGVVIDILVDVFK